MELELRWILSSLGILIVFMMLFFSKSIFVFVSLSTPLSLLARCTVQFDYAFIDVHYLYRTTVLHI